MWNSSLISSIFVMRFRNRWGNQMMEDPKVMEAFHTELGKYYTSKVNRQMF